MGLAALALVAVAPQVSRAAATVNRFSIMFSATPTSIAGGDFNEFISFVNETQLETRGLEGMDKVSSSWLFQAEFRYFVRPNIAVSAGVGQIRATTDREYLPAIDSAIQLHGEVLSVPIHVGGAYYLAPYNQGDFQARAFFGGGFLSHTHTRALFQQELVGIPDALSFTTSGSQDGPGYYVEFGGHMFFAARYSVILSAIYRSSEIRNLIDRETGLPYLDVKGEPYDLDLSGAGVRFGVAIGL